jgi:hypothetical protein
MWHAWERIVYRVLMGKLEKSDHLQSEGVDGVWEILGRLAWGE